MARWLRFFVATALAAIVGGAVDAGAQTRPMPTLPPPEAVAAAEEVRRPAWDYSVGAGLGWESNVGLQLSTGPSDFVGQFRGRVDRHVERPTTDLRVGASGRGFVYREQTEYNRIDGGLALDGGWRISGRTRATIGGGVSYDHSDSSAFLLDQGLLLPLTRTVGYHANAGLSHRISMRTSARGAVLARRLDFPESEVFVDSTSVRFTAALDRRLNERDTLSGELSSERARTLSGIESSPYWTHYFSAQWQHAFSRRSALLLDGGASYTPDSVASGLGESWRFYGGAGYNRAVGRSRLSAFYRREVVPVFGLGGLRLSDRFGLNAGIPLGRSWDLGLGTAYTRDAVAAESGGRQSRFDAFANLGTRLSRRLTLTAEGRYYRQAAFGAIPELDTLRVGVFLDFGPRGQVSTPR